jgi:NH3-dependent NAD+ synthetase
LGAYSRKDLTLEDYRTYSDLIGKALLAGGTDLADSFKANFDSVLNNPDLAPDMKEKFLNLLNTVDLTSEGSIKAFLQELQKIGIETEKVGIDKLVEDLEKLGKNLERVNLKDLLEDT